MGSGYPLDTQHSISPRGVVQVGQKGVFMSTMAVIPVYQVKMPKALTFELFGFFLTLLDDCVSKFDL